MAESDRIAAALSYEQDRPAFGNPSMLEQGRKMRERKQAEQVDRSAQNVKSDLLARALMYRYNPETLIGLTDTPGPQTLDEAAGLDPKVTNRTAIIPDWSRKEGWTNSQAGADFAKLMAASDPRNSYLMQPEEAMPLATNMMGGGVVASRLAPAPAGSLGMFIGKTAKNWNAAAEAKALEMEKAGANPQAIWQETGTWKGPDAAWRQEIPDNLAFLKGTGKFENVIMNAYDRGVEATKGQRPFYQPYTTKVGDVLSHGILQEAYPELMSIETQMTPKGSGNRGMLSIDDVGKQILHVNENLPAKQAESTMLHELQHAIQEKENFGRGGSLELVVKEANAEAEKIAKKLNEMKYGSKEYEKLYEQFVNARKNITVDQANEMYRRLAGEAEARATQKRQNLTSQQRRAEFPERSYDVPINELIIRR